MESEAISTPPMPFDTHDAVILRNAVDQIGRAKYSAEWEKEEQTGEIAEAASQRVREVTLVVARALGAGELAPLVRIVEGKAGGPLGVLNPQTLSIEEWLEALGSFQTEQRDVRPWVPVSQRRLIPQPHWLFMTRASLTAFLKQFSLATAGKETRAISELAKLLKAAPQMKKEAARDALSQFHLSSNGFEKRVWPEARMEANLPARAPAGRKPKCVERYSRR